MSQKDADGMANSVDRGLTIMPNFDYHYRRNPYQDPITIEGLTSWYYRHLKILQIFNE